MANFAIDLYFYSYNIDFPQIMKRACLKKACGVPYGLSVKNKNNI